MADINQAVTATPELQLFSTPPEIPQRDHTSIPFGRIVHHGTFTTTDAGAASALEVILTLPLQANSIWELVKGQLNLNAATIGTADQFEAARLEGTVQVQADGRPASVAMLPFTCATMMDFHGAARVYYQLMVPGMIAQIRNGGTFCSIAETCAQFPMGIHTSAAWPTFVFSTGSKDDVGAHVADYWFEWLGYTVEQNNQSALHDVVSTLG